MHRDKGKACEREARYCVRNWSTYNAGLIKRGNVTMWIGEAALEGIPDAGPTIELSSAARTEHTGR